MLILVASPIPFLLPHLSCCRYVRVFFFVFRDARSVNKTKASFETAEIRIGCLCCLVSISYRDAIEKDRERVKKREKKNINDRQVPTHSDVDGVVGKPSFS